MRCGVGDLGGYKCSDGLGGGYGAAACPRASSGSAGGDQCASMQHHSRLPLTAAPPRHALAKLVGRGQAPAIHPPNPRTTTAAPCPRDTPRPRALAAAEGQLEGARAQLVHADHVSKGHRQALSIHLAWACTARGAHV